MSRIVPCADASPVAPVSFAQRQLWLHAHLGPDEPIYNEPVTIHYTGCLDIGALEQSLTEILRRHQAWRTTFRIVDQDVRQVIQPLSDISLPVVDLRSWPEAERDEEARRIATEEAVRPFDLE